MPHGGQVLADALVAHGVERVFSVPGESFLAALDGLRDSGIDNVVCRQEGGAAMMADAHGKMTGAPGVLFVTRGPGASNAASGLHVAMQDGTPLVAFVGQIARDHRDRGAFQEMDYRAVFGTMVKWASEVDQADRLGEYVRRAFHVATSGRPGPVVLALPEDMLSGPAEPGDLRPVPAAPVGMPPGAIAEIRERLERAARPLVVVGGSQWSPETARTVQHWAEASDVPVAAVFRRQDYIDNRSPAYIGDLTVGMNPALAGRLQQADLLLVLGSRLGDIATGGYELFDPASLTIELIHVHPDAAEPGRVWRPELSVCAPAPAVVAALAEAGPIIGAPDWLAEGRAEYEAWQRPKATPGAVRQEEVIGWLSENLPEDAILTNGAGNYAAWLHRYFRFKQHGTQLAPTSGSMGYGFPAAVSASLRHPGRTVVCLAGDGCFQMTLNEMSTAIQHGAAPIVIVCNNGRYGTIRMHQERAYPGRPSGTDMASPDYAALARAYGGHGETVTDGAEFPAAFARAREAGTVAVIELVLDGDVLTPGQSLSDLAKP